MSGSGRGHLIETWTPEDEGFWREQGSRIAWPTLWVTTFCLVFAFATWFVTSALVVRLQGVGFKLSDTQLFWLAAMPGLAGGSFRILHLFFIPIFGTRLTVSVSTLSLLVPCLGWAYVVQRPDTPYWVLMTFALLAGFGGGNFSSFMPSTNLFFPKRLAGVALGFQAGIGNFGVSLVQFLVPWLVGWTMLGSMLGGGQTFVKAGKTGTVYLQNATLFWVPFVLLGGLWAWKSLRNVPVKATFAQQLDIFKEKHNWIMTSLYVMTFGSFAGFSATFPLLIKKVYGKFEDAPDPLTYAFLGPLVGSVVRVIFGPVSDRLGGALVTAVSGVGLVGSAIAVTWFTEPSSRGQFTGFLLSMLGLFFFSGIGNASTFKQIPVIFPPRQAGGVLGWTGAVAAYGPFAFSMLFAWVIAAKGAPTLFFYGAAVFYGLNVLLNWWYYQRRGAEKPC